MKTDAVIVGGGIAGLSTAWQLSLRGVQVTLLEREELLAAHATGRNAAIFRHLDASPGVARLAIRSRELLDHLLPASSATGWLSRTGGLFVAARDPALDPLESVARAHGVPVERLARPAVLRISPALEAGPVSAGLLVPGDGVIDIHSVTEALASQARKAGATIRTRAEVSSVVVASGRTSGVTLASGERLQASTVVIAAGAWAGALGQLPLTPWRRHLALLDAGASDARAPVVWCIDDEVYFRPESGGLLASPCDEEQSEPCSPVESPAALDLLAAKLGRVAPRLAGSGVRRSWACLRTFAPDRGLVVGPDPRVSGLHWIAGLGGHGMTAGVGAGEVLAAEVLGEHHPLSASLSPARLVG